MGLRSWIKHPLINNNIDLDSVESTLLHGRIVKSKPFLVKIYQDFYQKLRLAMPSQLENKIIVEIGSGGGFLKEIVPEVITSDLLKIEEIDRNFSALDMPFPDNSVDSFVMIDVLHHLPDSRTFLNEVVRCLKNRGKLIMIEPANTWFGKFIYQNFHHEPFDPSGEWGFPPGGPLTAANGAIPWIIFCRDKAQFAKEYPQLNVVRIHYHTPFRYLLSGGLSYRQLLPTFCYPLVKGIEYLLSPLRRHLAMFMTIEIVKEEHSGNAPV